MKVFISILAVCFVSLVLTASTAYSQQFALRTFGRSGGISVGIGPGGASFGVTSFNRGGNFGVVQFGGVVPIGGYGYGQDWGGVQHYGVYEMNPWAIRAQQQIYRGGVGYYQNPYSPQPIYYYPQPVYRAW